MSQRLEIQPPDCAEARRSGLAHALVLLLVLLSSGCLVGQDDANCDFAETCGECLEMDGCGWCPVGGCVDGSSLGPDFDACVDYRWDECTVRADPCAVHRSCDPCVLASSCGWCPEVGGGSCSLSPCAGRTNFCAPAPSCSDFFTCGGCLANDACEWDSGGTTVVCGADDCSSVFRDGFCRPKVFCF
ncbi:MAG: hypothetical protein AB8I08_20125 [Sandaracinaceae bacterium]